MVEKKTDTLHMRVDADDMRKFKTICKTRYRVKYTHMLGDIIKAFVEGRIRELEMILSNARIIEEDRKLDTIEVGARVQIQENGTPPEDYTIVGAAEADPGNGYISNESPQGKALMGHKAGEEVIVKAPNGEFSVTILKVK